MRRLHRTGRLHLQRGLPRPYLRVVCCGLAPRRRGRLHPGRHHGLLEIAVGSDADSADEVNVAVYDHEGLLLPGWPLRFGGSDEVRAITAGDLDGDGQVEIVVNKTNQGPATAVYQLDGSLMPGWPQIDHASCDPPPPAEPCWDFGGYNQNIGGEPG